MAQRTSEQTSDFLKTLMDYYRRQGRELPWRDLSGSKADVAYRILISEMMLQQTQVSRVIPKYHEFLKTFPDLTSLAEASLGEVLHCWNGLGYNRRAKYIWQSAGIIVAKYHGQVPSTRIELQTLPGIGSNTAGAILVYAYNQPELFIETNIRTVLIHHFFATQERVSDAAIAARLDQILSVLPSCPDSTYRTFYWALMDYGSYLKQTVGNLSRASQTYVRQSKFSGSQRQLRGQVLRLLQGQTLTKTEFNDQLAADARLERVLADLTAEGLIRKNGKVYSAIR